MYLDNPLNTAREIQLSRTSAAISVGASTCICYMVTFNEPSNFVDLASVLFDDLELLSPLMNLIPYNRPILSRIRSVFRNRFLM